MKIEWLSLGSNALIVAIISAISGHFFNRKLEELKKETAIYTLRYQTLHIKKAEAIESIYASLEKAIRYMTHVVSPWQSGNDEEFKQNFRTASLTYQEFEDTYSAKKIYLSPTLACKLDAMSVEMKTLWIGFARNHPTLSNRQNIDFKKWDKAWDAFTQNGNIPAALKELEDNFREQLSATGDSSSQPDN